MEYKIEKSLASGSTGKVKKAILYDKVFAIKIIDKSKKDEKDIQKEIKILSLVQHRNIVKLLDHYKDQNNYYLVMKLAETELFDLIEPDEGLNPTLCHFYFKQLVSAISYLHGIGIVHRDIKPENILLDQDGNLVLTDFGSATLFIYKEKRRILRSVVGSYRYMAPEILAERYDNSVDIWSMGILLFVMITGCSLWEMPTIEDENFAKYVQMRNHDYFPFSKLSKSKLELFKKMCSYRCLNRILIKDLQKDDWVNKKSILENENGMCINKSYLIDYLSPKIVKRVAFSQPENFLFRQGNANFIASQPNNNFFDLPSLKRLYLQKTKTVVIKQIEKVFKQMVVLFNTNNNIINFTTVDSARNELSGEIQIENLLKTCCISIVRLKGDCIEFNRFFNSFNEIIKTYH